MTDKPTVHEGWLVLPVSVKFTTPAICRIEDISAVIIDYPFDDWDGETQPVQPIYGEGTYTYSLTTTSANINFEEASDEEASDEEVSDEEELETIILLKSNHKIGTERKWFDLIRELVLK